MASVKGVNVTKLDSVPARLPEVNAWHGRLRVQYDEYEAAALADGSDIAVARLPRGARVIDVVVHHDALGASTTLEVGDAADSDRFVAARSTASAGSIALSADGAIAGFGHEYDGATDLKLTLGGGAATGTVRSAVFYTVD